MLGNLLDTELYQRRKAVQRLLRALRPKRHGATIVPVHIVGPSRVGSPTFVVATDDKAGDSHRDWFFSTAARTIRGQYREKWMPRERNDWCLSEVSMHLYVVSGPSPNERSEVLALHCEPTHGGVALTDKVKRGFHVHVSADRNLLSHSHIPLHITDFTAPFADDDSFHSAIETAMEVVAIEVVQRLL